jgi:hypothetical protein
LNSSKLLPSGTNPTYNKDTKICPSIVSHGVTPTIHSSHYLLSYHKLPCEGRRRYLPFGAMGSVKFYEVDILS